MVRFRRRGPNPQRQGGIAFPRVPFAWTKDDEPDSGRRIFEPDLPGRKRKLRLTSALKAVQGLPRLAIAGQKQRNGFFDMSAHLLPCEMLKAWRDETKVLVVGDNCPEKEFCGKLGFGAAQFPASSGAAKVARELW